MYLKYNNYLKANVHWQEITDLKLGLEVNSFWCEINNFKEKKTH